MREYIVGQKVSVLQSCKIKHGFVVTKITKTGQIVVERQDEKFRFTPEGNEIGTISAFYGKARLIA